MAGRACVVTNPDSIRLSHGGQALFHYRHVLWSNLLFMSHWLSSAAPASQLQAVSQSGPPATAAVISCRQRRHRKMTFSSRPNLTNSSVLTDSQLMCLRAQAHLSLSRLILSFPPQSRHLSLIVGKPTVIRSSLCHFSSAFHLSPLPNRPRWLKPPFMQLQGAGAKEF